MLRLLKNPSFGVPQIRRLIPVFQEKSNQVCIIVGMKCLDQLVTRQLRDVWLAQMDKNSEGTTIEVLSWLGRATMDIIGTAGKADSAVEPFETDCKFLRLWIRVQFVV